MEIFSLPFMLIGSCISLAGFIFWIVALIDCIKRDFRGDNEKVIWVLVIVLANWIGALIYWFVGRPNGRLRSW